jgi:hypothetical protein
MRITGPVLQDATKLNLAGGKSFDTGDRMSTAGASQVALLMTGPVLQASKWSLQLQNL